MESTLLELSLLEEKNKLWREQHEERVKLMEQHYEQEFAKIEEDFRRAVQKMEADFSAEREAVLRQYSGYKTQPKMDCSSAPHPNRTYSPEPSSQTKPLQKLTAVSRSAINGDLKAASHKERGEITKTISADSPTAVSFVSSQAVTSSAYKQEKKHTIRPAIPKNESMCDTIPKNTISFVKCFGIDDCVNDDDDDGSTKQVANRVPYPMVSEKQCVRGRKQSKHYRLKPLLFDPGGDRMNEAHHWILPPARQKSRNTMIRLPWVMLCGRNGKFGAADGDYYTRGYRIRIYGGVVLPSG